MDPEDLRYAKRMLFLPIIFRGLDGVLFLSFASDSDVSLPGIISSLKIQ
jgi:hypothetical protein